MKNFNLFIITDNMNNLFKGIDNTTLLSYVTLLLSVAILLSIVFGCSYRKRYERFEEKEEKEESKEPEKDLSDKEKSLLEGLKNGSIDEKKLETFISEKTIDKKTVEKLIDFIQTQFELDNKKKA
jgi:hypothetical protein